MQIRAAAANNADIDFYEGGSRQMRHHYEGSDDSINFLDADQSHGVKLTQNSSAWVSASDVRLKERIQDLTVLDKLSKFRAVSFDWKSTGQHDIGVIGQELYDIFPEFVTVGDDATTSPSLADGTAWSVAYSQLGAVALQGVKELNEKVQHIQAAGHGDLTITGPIIKGLQAHERMIQDLSAEHARLKQENEQLNARLEALEDKVK